MKLVKVTEQDKEVFYLASDLDQVYRKLTLSSIVATKIEVVDNLCVLGLCEAKTPAALVELCCLQVNVLIEEIRGSSRKKRLVQIRTAISYLLRKRFNLSYPDIADLLYKDHSTIINQIKNGASKPEVQGLIQKFEVLLNGSN